MRSFTSAVLVPLFFSTIIAVLVVLSAVTSDPRVVADLSESFRAAVVVLSGDIHFSSPPAPRIVYRPVPQVASGPVSQVGPKRGQLPSHAPNYLTRRQSFEYYSEMARLSGLRVSRTTVIGLRGLSPNGRRHSSNDNATPYDDTFVILDPDTQTATEFLGATHAGEAANPLSPQGIAQIEPGLYQATPSGHYLGMSSWYVTTAYGSGFIPCRRDANGNGYIDNTEEERLWASEILFHNGCSIYYGASRGCQVLPPGEMERFVGEVGSQTSFDYLLLDANSKL